MKILKEGEVVQKTKKCTCYKCKSRLEFTNDDIQSDRDGTYIVCPTCQSFIQQDYIKSITIL